MFKPQQLYSQLDSSSASTFFNQYAEAAQKGALAVQQFNDSLTDSGMKQYLSTVEAGKATFSGYTKYINGANTALKGMTASAKLAAVGQQLLSTALNAAVVMAASWAIEEFVKGINSAITAQSDAIEKANEIKSAWKEQDDTLSKMKSTIDDVGTEYEKLSQGVDSFGNNVSLTTDEYTRYNEIANQIADLFPTMVTGWTDEGNAILRAKGNVEALTSAYKDAQNAQYAKVMAGATDVLSGYNAKVNNNSSIASDTAGLQTQLSLVRKLLAATAAMNKSQVMGLVHNNQLAVNDVLSGAGLSTYNTTSPMFDLDVSNYLMGQKDAILSYSKTLISQLNAELASLRTIPEAYLGSNTEYQSLSENAKVIVSSIVSSFNTEWYNQFGGDVNKLYLWLQSNIVDVFSKKGFQKSLADMISVKSSFDNNKTSIDSYQKYVDSFISGLQGVSPQVQLALSEFFTPDVSVMVAHTKTLLQDQYDNMVGSLSLDEIKIAYSLENVGDLTWDQLLQKIADAKKEAALGIDTIKTSVANFATSQSTALEVIKSVSEGGLTEENYTKLISANEAYSAAIDTTNGKLAVNSQKIDEINEKQAQEIQTNIAAAKSQAISNYKANYVAITANQQALARLNTEITNNDKAIKAATDANSDNLKSLQDTGDELEKSKKILEDNIAQYTSQNDTLLDNINTYDRLSSAISSATSAYKKWLNSQNQPESGDQYRSTIDAIKTMKELLKEGKTNTNQYKAGLEYLVPQEISDKGPKAVKSYISKISKYFKDGSEGISNFTKDLTKAKDENGKALAVFDPKTNHLEIYKNKISTIAKALGLTEETTYALLAGLDEYMDVQFDNPDLGTSQLTTQIEQTKKDLETAKKTAEEAQTAYDKAKGTAKEADAKKALDDANRKQQEAQTALDNANAQLIANTPSKTLEEQVADLQSAIAGIVSQGIPVTLVFDAQKQVLQIQAQINGTGGAAVPTTLDQTGANSDLTVIKGNIQTGTPAQIPTELQIPPGNPIVIGAVDDTTSTITSVQTNIDNLVKYAKDHPVVLNVQNGSGEGAGNSGSLPDVGLPDLSPEGLLSLFTPKSKSTTGGEGSTGGQTTGSGTISDKVNKEIDDANKIVQDNPVEVPVVIIPKDSDQSLLLPGMSQEDLEKWVKDHSSSNSSNSDNGVSLDIEPKVSVGDLSGEYQKMDSFIAKYDNKTITIKAKVVTENAALDSGKKAVTSPETALIAEKRPEILVKDGKYSIVENPAFVNLKPGDQVIGGAETARILKGGYKTSGRALDPGTNDSSSSGSNAEASGDGSPPDTKNTKKSNPVVAYLNKLSKLKDWIEQALSDAQEKTQDIIDDANDSLSSYINRQQSLVQAINATEKEISKNEKAYTLYTDKANEVAKKTGLSDELINKIQHGSLDISTLDSSTKKKVEAYKEWYDKAKAVKDTIEDLKDQEKELAKEQLDNVISQYEAQVGVLENRISENSNKVDLKKALGKEITAADYTDSVNANKEKLAKLQQERLDVQLKLASLVASGAIEQGSEEWYNYQDTINGIDDSINQTQTDVQSLEDTINQIAIDNLQYALNALSQSQQVIQNLMDLHAAQGSTNTEADYNDLISIADQTISNLEQQNNLLRQQQADLDVNSEKYQELQDTIDQNTNSIADAKNQQEQWNDAISDLNIAALNKRKEELENTNDKLQRQKDLQDAIQKVEDARQRKKLVYKEGVGFVREVDQVALQEAQNNLDQKRHDETIAAIEDAIKAIEDLKSTDNIYDENGNKIPQYADGGVNVKGGISKLHGTKSSPELIFNAEAGAKLFDYITGTPDLAANAVNDILSKVNLAGIGAYGTSANKSYVISNPVINLSGVNDTQTFAQKLTREFSALMQQEMSKYN